MEAGVDFVTNEVGGGPSRIKHHVDPMGDLHTFFVWRIRPRRIYDEQAFYFVSSSEGAERTFIEIVSETATCPLYLYHVTTTAHYFPGAVVHAHSI